MAAHVLLKVDNRFEARKPTSLTYWPIKLIRLAYTVDNVHSISETLRQHVDETGQAVAILVG